MARRPGHPKIGSWWRRLLSALGVGAGTCAGVELTPEQDLEIAYRVSSDGDLPHAAHHAAAVLMADPTDRRALQLLDRLVAKSHEFGADPLDLAPMSKNAWAGHVAVRAHVLYRLERYGEATDLLADLAYGDAERPWWKWMADWCADPAVAAAGSPDRVAGVLSQVVTAHPGGVISDPAARAELETALSALARLTAAHPRHEALRFIHVSVVRKTGRGAEAVELASAWRRDLPSWRSAVSLAMAHEARGDVDAAVAGYADAAALDPQDSTAPADAANLCAAHRRFNSAIEWAERAKRNDPEKQTAAWMLSCLLRHRAGDAEALRELGELQSQYPNLRAPADGAMQQLGPYGAFIPEPSEATINMVRQVAGEGRDLKTMSQLTVNVSSLESPSSRLAVDRAFGGGGKVSVRVAGIPTPDPRVPLRPVAWTIWTYDGNDPRPGLPPPPPNVEEAVARLAATRYDRDAWLERAAALARELQETTGGSDVLAPSLLAVMVNPPSAPPDGIEPWDWIRHVQFAAAFTIAKLDGSWAQSPRRQALLSLIYGPADWTTEAGIVAVAAVVREEGADEAAQREIGQALADLAQALPSIGHCCYADALGRAVGALPPTAIINRSDFDPLWACLAAE